MKCQQVELARFFGTAELLGRYRHVPLERGIRRRDTEPARREHWNFDRTLQVISPVAASRHLVSILA